MVEVEEAGAAAATEGAAEEVLAADMEEALAVAEHTFLEVDSAAGARE
jgi:hypothetical protein